MVAPTGARYAATQFTINSFPGRPGGQRPVGRLLEATGGTLYGTTSGGGKHGFGTVFKLMPPAAGRTNWTQSVLYSFAGGADGVNPGAGLIADASGALYGTTIFGGPPCNAQQLGCGTVFKLTPPAAGQTTWTESVLYAFTGGHDGGFPGAELLADASGAFYSTTSAGGSGSGSMGTVFKLTPPAGGKTTWTESVLHAFSAGTDGTQPYSPLIADSSGALYGTTSGGGNGRFCCGTAFKLTPPASGQTAWTESVLYRFSGGADGANPDVGLIADAAGAVYSTTAHGGAGYGTVFKLTPPAARQTAWTESVLHAFTGGADGSTPLAGLIGGAGGALYGTTPDGGTCKPQPQLGCGVVFKLTPPAAGQTKWTETVQHNFTGRPGDGTQPAGLIASPRGALYGVTAGGGAYGRGSVFLLK